MSTTTTPCDSPTTTTLSSDDDENYNDGHVIQKKKRRESEAKISIFSNDVVLSPSRVDIIGKNDDLFKKQPAAVASASASASDRIIVIEQQPEAETITTTTTAAGTYKTLGGLSSTDDENDAGFRTPTSIDQRIPDQRPCPPPPRKPVQTLKSLLTNGNGNGNGGGGSDTGAGEGGCFLKRKNNSILSPSSSTPISPTLHLLLDFSDEVDSMFPASVRANFGCKIKKARSV